MPLGTGQGAAVHGVFGYKKPHQLFHCDPLQLIRRVRGGNVQLTQTVGQPKLPADLFQLSHGYVNITVDGYLHTARFGIDIRSNDGRLRKHALQRLRRLIVREHIEEIDLLFHFDTR